MGAMIGHEIEWAVSMDPKKVFDTKQTELELTDASDADLIDVLYKLNNPATAASVLQPTTLKNYLPTMRQQWAARWQKFRTDRGYRKRAMIITGISLVVILLLLKLMQMMFAPGPLPLTPQRLGDLQDNARMLQRMLENYSVDMGQFPASLADLGKAGNLKDYNKLRTNPLTAETGGPMSSTWCRDGQPDGTDPWIGKIGYEPISRNGRTIGYRLYLGGDGGRPVKINGQVFTIDQNAGSPRPEVAK